MCNKNGRASLLATEQSGNPNPGNQLGRAHSSYTHTHTHTQPRDSFQVGETERCINTPAYCPVDSTVLLVSPFDIRRPLRIGSTGSVRTQRVATSGRHSS